MLAQYSEIKRNGSDWQAIASNDVNNIMDDADILNGVEWLTYELGKEDLPESVEDIRGKIQNEPERVFVYVANDAAIYFGLDSVSEEDA
jgi:hypothetical protein